MEIDLKGLSPEQRRQLLAQLQDEEKQNRQARRESYEALRGDFMRDVFHRVEGIVEDVSAFKKWIDGESESFKKVMAEYGQTRNDDQNSFTVVDGDLKLEIRSNKVKTFDERADLAADRLIDYLRDYALKSDKGSKTIIIIGVAIILIAALVIIGTMNGWFSHKNEVEVPKFIGCTYEEAVAKAEEVGLTIERGEDVFSNDQEEGYVTAQSPEAGTMVVEGKALVALDVLGMCMSFVLMEPDAYALPSSQLLGLLLEVHELLVGHTWLDNQARLTKRGKGLLALLPRLLGVVTFCSLDERNDGLPCSDGCILIDGAIGVAEVGIDV